MDPGGIQVRLCYTTIFLLPSNIRSPQCESVTRNTGVPVLRHKSMKPAYSCISAIRGYFSSLRFPIRDGELIIVGDRIFTDMVMANRMRRATPGLVTMTFTCAYEDEGADGEEKDSAKDNPDGPLAIWTTGVWEKEATVMRWWEKRLVHVVRRWTHAEQKEIPSRFIQEPLEVRRARTGILSGLFGMLSQRRNN